MIQKQKERGAVLLTTLLIMTLMASIAVAMFDDVRLAVRRAMAVQSQAQIEWYGKGAQDFAGQYLNQQLLTSSPAEIGRGLSRAEPFVFPIEDGLMTFSVQDGTDCLSLGAFDKAPPRRVFRQLLEVLGIDPQSAGALTSAAVDWQDRDQQALPDGAEDGDYLSKNPPYRAANSPMNTTGELRAVKGFGPELFTALRPYLCSRSNAEHAININALSPAGAPLLAALLGGRDFANAAAQLISSRPSQGFDSLDTLLVHPALAGLDLRDADLEAIMFAPRFIWVEAQIEFAGQTAYRSFEFDISSGRAIRVSQFRGEDALRSFARSAELGNETP